MKPLFIYILLLWYISNETLAQKNTDTEKVYIEVVELPKKEAKTNSVVLSLDEDKKGQKAALGGIGALLIPAAVDFAVNQISVVLKKRAAKFVGKYNSKYVGDNFYYTDSTSVQPRIKQFVIVRENAAQRNAEIVLRPVFSTDGAFFRLEVEKVHIEAGRTKKIKNNIDIKLNIAFISKNISGGSTYAQNDTKDLEILVEGLRIGEVFQNLKSAGTQWIKMPLPSKNSNSKIIGGGSFELLVDVTETDSFKKRAEAISTKYNENQKTIGDVLKKLFDNKD